MIPSHIETFVSDHRGSPNPVGGPLYGPLLMLISFLQVCGDHVKRFEFDNQLTLPQHLRHSVFWVRFGILGPLGGQLPCSLLHMLYTNST